MAVKKNKFYGNAYRKTFRANQTTAVYEVDENFAFGDGYSAKDICFEPRFGKIRPVLHIVASAEVCTETRRMDERDHKHHQRENQCHLGSKRCESIHCETCPYFLSGRKGGAPLSLDTLYEETEYEPEDDNQLASPEQKLEKAELWNIFFRFMCTLSSEEQILAEGIMNKVPDRKLMEKLGITKQSTLSSWKMSVKKKMQEAMKDFNP